MITRATKLQLVAFVAVTVAGLAYLLASYTPLPRALGAGYTVTARFHEYGGIYPGALVTYRGHPVGEVTDLRLIHNGVAVEMHLEESRIPEDTIAKVRQLSVVGEQFVDLRPRSTGGPYLTDGDVIPMRRTDTGPPTEALLSNLSALLTSIGEQNLVTVVNELDKAFDGVAPQLERLLDSTTALVDTADANLAETKALIRNGQTVLATQVDVRGAITSFAQNLAQLTRQLRQSDEDIRATLRRGIPFSRETIALLNQLSPTLRMLLTNLVTVGQVTVPRLPGLEQALVVYPLDIATAFTVLPGDGTVHFALIPNLNAPPPCTEGYAVGPRRYPQDTTPQDGEITGFCREDDDADIAVRGSRYAGVGEQPASPASTSEREGVLELYLPPQK